MSSPSTKTARYGSWKSPITSELIVAQSITLSEVCLDGGYVYWLEGRPQEQGRYVVVRAGADGQPTDITPPPYNARTRVHEYGGGSSTAACIGRWRACPRRGRSRRSHRGVTGSGATPTG